MNSGLSALNCYRPGSDADLDSDVPLDTTGPSTSTGMGGWRKGIPQGLPQENVWPPWPPANETELEKAGRLEEEREAKRISDAIDRALESERQALRRPPKGEMKLLLLGQSESGKSTMLKNFQIQFAPAALRAEGCAWRAVVHLNLVRAVNFMLDVLAKPAPPALHAGDASPTVAAFSHRISMTPQPNSDVRRFKLALSPLRQVEMILSRHLSADEASGAVTGEKEVPEVQRRRAAEVTIRGGHSWRALLQQQQEPEEGRSRYSEGRADDMENARYIMDACREDVVAMWTSEAVRSALREEGVLLEHQSHFFLDHADRVMQSQYEPTFDDILRARLQTMGVEEHHLIMESGAENGQHWIFYDVGGARGQRESWVPFFDHVNAIIFLCSTAGFNEVLAEDRTVNRLMDSFNAWKTVCSSPLLASVQFILLLNKTDILDARLKSGVHFATYVESYKGENDLEHVTDYLKRKLVAIHRHHSPQQRKLHVHCTCAVDIDNTSPVLMRIRDTILVNHLAAVQLI